MTTLLPAFKRHFTPVSATTAVWLPSPGAGREAVTMDSQLRQMRRRMVTPAYSETTIRSGPAEGLREQLFDSRASLKMMTAAVAMHLDRDWRDGLFRQLDSLLAYESWDEDDQRPAAASYYTFLRMILYIKPNRRPGLGLSHNGNLIAAWTVGANRLTIEALPKDQLRWVLSRQIDEDLERAAAITPIHRLPDVLAPYRPNIWFVDGEVRPDPH